MNFFNKNLLKLLIINFIFLNSGNVVYASGNYFPKKSFDACIVAATDLLEEFKLNYDEIKNKCECVKNRWAGDIPSDQYFWERAGKDSATLFLIECSRSNIVKTFSGAVLNSEKIIYRKKIFKNNINEMKKIEGLGFCVGVKSYDEMHRVARDESAAYAGLDRSWFKSMYQKCEAEFN